MRVLYDLRGAQSRLHPERGIARWVSGLFEALACHPGVDELHGLVDERVPSPAIADVLRASGRLVTTTTAIDLISGRDVPWIVHISSPFELDYSFTELWPAAFHAPKVLRAVTLYDVIPLLFPEVHSQTFLRRWAYRAELVRGADVVLGISQYTADDGIAKLGLRADRVHAVGTGIPSGDSAADRGSLPEGVTGEFILYAGGLEHRRKNIDALVRAFGLLRDELRQRLSLVIIGRIDDTTRRNLLDGADRAGVLDRVTFTGFVTDDELLTLYARCACFVYPSLYEGFGLPIAEAMSMGAPVVCSNATSCAEVAALPDAIFDPTDEAEMARVMSRVIDEPAFADRLRVAGKAKARSLTWDAVADRTVTAYELTIARRWPRHARGPVLGAATGTIVSD